MKDINLFDVLKKMNVEQPESVSAYFINNVENVNAGKKGWGNIKIAITTEDAQEVMRGMLSGHIKKTVMLFIVDREVMSEKQNILIGECFPPAP